MSFIEPTHIVPKDFAPASSESSFSLSFLGTKQRENTEDLTEVV